MAKKKRKNKAAHARTSHPNERRHVVSYDDIGQAPVPPVPRHKVSYASDVDSDEENEDEAPEQRHEVVSQSELRERERPQTDVTYGQIGAFPGLDPRDNRPFYGPANDGLDYLRMVRSEARKIPHVVSAPTTEAQDADYEAYDEEECDDDYDYYEENNEGYYEDGAYVGPPSAKPILEPQPTSIHPQQAFYNSLSLRFQKLRDVLRKPPSVSELQSLPPNHPISFPTGNRHAEIMATKEWKYHILHTVPLIPQLAAMDTASVLHVLKLCEGQLENCRSGNIPQILGLWIWGLLGRVDDVETLGTREVSVVREVAKMGVWVRGMHVRAKEGRVAEFGGYPDRGGEEEEVYEEEGVEVRGEQEGDVDVDVGMADEDLSSKLEAKKRELLDAEAGGKGGTEVKAKEETEIKAEAHVENEKVDAEDEEVMDDGDIIEEGYTEEEEEREKEEDFPDANTALTIDMVITVAAEFYGQKDLLVGRLPWEF